MSQEMHKMKPKKPGDDGDKRLMVLAGIMGLCLVLALGIALAVGGGKNGGGKGIVAQQNTTTSVAAPTGSSATLTIEQVEVPPLSIYHRRNPFRPLVNMESSTPTAAVSSTPTGGAAVVTAPPELGADAGSTDNVVSRALTLEGVTKQGNQMYARITIGDQAFDKVAVGDTFADNYKLLALGDDASATILYGDERFTIYAGQSIYR